MMLSVKCCRRTRRVALVGLPPLQLVAPMRQAALYRRCITMDNRISLLDFVHLAFSSRIIARGERSQAYPPVVRWIDYHQQVALVHELIIYDGQLDDAVGDLRCHR